MTNGPRDANALLSDPIALHSVLHPERLVAIDLATHRRWSYRELHNDIQKAMSVLARIGVNRGDRVAAVCQNSVWLVVLQQALMRLGAIFVPLNWRLAERELSELLADCAASIVYTDSSVCSSQLLDNRTLDIVAFGAAVDAAEPAESVSTTELTTTCMILYTSGTCGAPKGVLVTPQFLLATGINFQVLGEVNSRSVFLCDCPMFHVIGIATSIWPELYCGGAFVVSPKFDAGLTNERLADAVLGITHYFCVPQMADALSRAPGFDPSRWKKLRALFTGGAPNPPARINSWLDRGIRMVDGYGMTETGTTLGMPLSEELIRAKAGSVGQPGPMTAIRIVDESGRDVPAGVPGEILISGLNVTSGYWNRPEERSRSFTEDGWLRTGDIGKLDSDGFVFVIDRRKDTFISGGENVYPAEVEAALLEHPSVRESAVVGVPDDAWGEVGRAFIVPVWGCQPGQDELSRHCRLCIAAFKVPKEFVLVDSLPRTASGKVMKQMLRI
ncbi:putative acyl-CoA synthetase [Thozetella sp. PMI_491]|nr:putative acyl-CoA synthetase [Thozetella sp. PMI_491]